MADDDRVAPIPERMSPMALAGVASIAAGATATFAAGRVGDHRQAVVLLVLLGAGQFAWGIWALLRATRSGTVLGAALHFTGLALWLGAATSGLSFIQGLEPRWTIDATLVAAIVTSAAAGFGALARLIDGRPEADQPAPPARTLWALTAAATLVVAVAAVASVEPSSPSTVVEAPAAPAVATTTAGGLIGLPSSGGGNIDQELGALIETTDTGSTTSVVPTTVPG